MPRGCGQGGDLGSHVLKLVETQLELFWGESCLPVRTTCLELYTSKKCLKSPLCWAAAVAGDTPTREAASTLLVSPFILFQLYSFLLLEVPFASFPKFHGHFRVPCSLFMFFDPFF